MLAYTFICLFPPTLISLLSVFRKYPVGSSESYFPATSLLELNTVKSAPVWWYITINLPLSSLTFESLKYSCCSSVNSFPSLSAFLLSCFKMSLSFLLFWDILLLEGVMFLSDFPSLDNGLLLLLLSFIVISLKLITSYKYNFLPLLPMIISAV